MLMVEAGVWTDREREHKGFHCFEFPRREKRGRWVGMVDGIMFQVMWSGLFLLWDTGGGVSSGEEQRERERDTDF